MTDQIRFDGFDITPDEGTELCIHYLRMAVKFFEASPDDMNESLLSEINRLGLAEDERNAIVAFIDSLLKYHENLKKKYTF